MILHIGIKLNKMNKIEVIICITWQMPHNTGIVSMPATSDMFKKMNYTVPDNSNRSTICTIFNW